ncbi:sciellin [Polypterus senegalus]|uniref:sciellin n=1 Tax=Polypterus senegalus TaxID=55291 RepID=UPI0019636B2C|nr:sciellin [Polypterus senegalus]
MRQFSGVDGVWQVQKSDISGLSSFRHTYSAPPRAATLNESGIKFLVAITGRIPEEINTETVRERQFNKEIRRPAGKMSSIFKKTNDSDIDKNKSDRSRVLQDSKRKTAVLQDNSWIRKRQDEEVVKDENFGKTVLHRYKSEDSLGQNNSPQADERDGSTTSVTKLMKRFSSSEQLPTGKDTDDKYKRQSSMKVEEPKMTILTSNPFSSGLKTTEMETKTSISSRSAPDGQNASVMPQVKSPVRSDSTETKRLSLYASKYDNAPRKSDVQSPGYRDDLTDVTSPTEKFDKGKPAILSPKPSSGNMVADLKGKFSNGTASTPSTTKSSEIALNKANLKDGKVPPVSSAKTSELIDVSMTSPSLEKGNTGSVLNTKTVGPAVQSATTEKSTKGTWEPVKAPGSRDVDIAKSESPSKPSSSSSSFSVKDTEFIKPEIPEKSPTSTIISKASDQTYTKSDSSPKSSPSSSSSSSLARDLDFIKPEPPSRPPASSNSSLSRDLNSAMRAQVSSMSTANSKSGPSTTTTIRENNSGNLDSFSKSGPGTATTLRTTEHIYDTNTPSSTTTSYSITRKGEPRENNSGNLDSFNKSGPGTATTLRENNSGNLDSFSKSGPGTATTLRTTEHIYDTNTLSSTTTSYSITRKGEPRENNSGNLDSFSKSGPGTATTLRTTEHIYDTNTPSSTTTSYSITRKGEPRENNSGNLDSFSKSGPGTATTLRTTEHIYDTNTPSSTTTSYSITRKGEPRSEYSYDFIDGASPHTSSYSSNKFDSSFNLNSSPPETYVYTKTSLVENSKPQVNVNDNVSSSSIKTVYSTSDRNIIDKDLCTYCRKPLGIDPKMILNELHINCHATCFKCEVCNASLGNLKAGDSLWLYRRTVHCENCFGITRDKWRI